MAIILLVDDESSKLEQTKQMLEESYDLLCAASAREALSACESVKPDLVITDFMMLDITGFEMLQILQDQPDAPVETVVKLALKMIK